MEMLQAAIEQVRESISEFDVYLRRRILSSFPTLAPLLREIRDLVGTVDLNYLSKVPIRTLSVLHTKIDQATDCIRKFMVNSFPPEDQVPLGGGVVRPAALVQNRENITCWEGQLTSIHDELFHLKMKSLLDLMEILKQPSRKLECEHGIWPRYQYGLQRLPPSRVRS
jgi:hypothetical protein